MSKVADNVPNLQYGQRARLYEGRRAIARHSGVLQTDTGPLADALGARGAAVLTGRFGPDAGVAASVRSLRRPIRTLRPAVVHSHLAYADIVFDDFRAPSIMEVPGAREVAVEFFTMSKSYNMAGWRVGAVVGHADYLKAILRFKSNMDSGQFLPVQRAAATALQLPPEWHAALNAVYHDRRNEAEGIMNTLGCRLDTAQQGMFLWGEIPSSYRDAYQLSDELLYEKHLFLTPGGIFGSNGDRHIRISLCSPVATLQEAGSRIAPADSGSRELLSGHLITDSNNRP